MSISRRQFMFQAGGTVCAVCLSACSRGEEFAQGAKTRIVWLNEKLEGLARGVRPFPVERVALVRDDSGIGAVSLVCTHQNCLLRLDLSAGHLAECPCHGSLFGARGEVITGPATVDLPWFKVLVGEDQRLGVDFTSPVSWNWRYAVQ